MKKSLLLSVFLFSLTFCLAQKDKDFILTLHQDTIYGKVKINDNDPHITFIHKRKRLYFHPAALRYFGVYKEGQYQRFKSVKNAKGKHLFAEVLLEGKMKLYKYREYVKNKEGILTLKELYFIGKSDEKLITMYPNSFNLILEVLAKEKPALLAKAHTVNYKEVPRFVASYNQF